MEAKLDLVLAIFFFGLGRFLKRTGAVIFFSKQKRQKYDHKVLPNVQMDVSKNRGTPK